MPETPSTSSSPSDSGVLRLVKPSSVCRFFSLGQSGKGLDPLPSCLCCYSHWGDSPSIFPGDHCHWGKSEIQNIELSLEQEERVNLPMWHLSKRGVSHIRIFPFGFLFSSPEQEVNCESLQQDTDGETNKLTGVLTLIYTLIDIIASHSVII